MVFRTNGWIDFPGGRIEEHETDLAEALRREVREETSLEIDVGEPFVTGIARGNTVFLVGYRCRYRSGDVILSEEHRSFRWVDRSDYGALDDGSIAFEMLRCYFEGPAP